MMEETLKTLITDQWGGGFSNNQRNLALRFLVNSLYKVNTYFRSQIQSIFIYNSNKYSFNEMINLVESLAKQAIIYYNNNSDKISLALFSKICVSYCIMTILD